MKDTWQAALKCVLEATELKADWQGQAVGLSLEINYHCSQRGAEVQSLCV